MIKKSLVLLAGLLLVAGCGTGNTTSVESAAPTNSPGCAADATKNEEAGFCLKLPAGYGLTSSLSTAKDKRSFGYGNSSGHVTIDVTTTQDPAAWDRELALFTANDPTKSEFQLTDLPGGAKFITWVWTTDGLTQTNYLIHTDTKIVTCWASSFDKAAPELSACKSLRLV